MTPRSGPWRSCLQGPSRCPRCASTQPEHEKGPTSSQPRISSSKKHAPDEAPAQRAARLEAALAELVGALAKVERRVARSASRAHDQRANQLVCPLGVELRERLLKPTALFSQVAQRSRERRRHLRRAPPNRALSHAAHHDPRLLCQLPTTKRAPTIVPAGPAVMRACFPRSRQRRRRHIPQRARSGPRARRFRR